MTNDEYIIELDEYVDLSYFNLCVEEFKNSSNINNKFAVAISGGPDSLSLAFLSKCLSIVNKKKAKFYIVNHNLRKGSLLEAKLVASKLKKFGINCKILNWYGKKPTKNIQSIARNARYNILRKECKKNKSYIL